MAKNLSFIELFECYKNLLTDRQIKIFTEYYIYDYSLGEIAENENISRQSVLDCVKKVEKQLSDYEIKLGLNKLKKGILEIFQDTDDEILKESILALLKGN